MTLLRGSATLAAFPCVAVLGLLFAFPEFFLTTVFDEKFVDAAPALRLMTIGWLAWVLSGSCGLTLMMTGHERSCMLATVVPGVLYLALCPLAIQHFGVEGAAGCAAAWQVFSNVLCVLLVFHYCRIWTPVTLSVATVRRCVGIIHAGKR